MEISTEKESRTSVDTLLNGNLLWEALPAAINKALQDDEYLQNVEEVNEETRSKLSNEAVKLKEFLNGFIGDNSSENNDFGVSSTREDVGVSENDQSEEDDILLELDVEASSAENDQFNEAQLIESLNDMDTLEVDNSNLLETTARPTRCWINEPSYVHW